MCEMGSYGLELFLAHCCLSLQCETEMAAALSTTDKVLPRPLEPELLELTRAIQEFLRWCRTLKTFIMGSSFEGSRTLSLRSAELCAKFISR